jgi:Xaa-Pro aminopeptidase
MTSPQSILLPLAALRHLLASHKLAGALIPRADEFQSEYVPPHAERLHWLTGFSGSAGFAIVLRDRAALFVDGRYTLQARQEVDTLLIDIVPLAETTPADWLAEHLQAGDSIAFDPWLFTRKGLERFQAVCRDRQAALVPLTPGPVDQLWTTARPLPPASVVELHPLDCAGVSWQDKVARLREHLTSKLLAAALVSDPPSLCWLLNIRGRDVPHTPLVLANALVPCAGPVTVFVAPERVPAAVRAAFGDAVQWQAPETLTTHLRATDGSSARILLDQATAPVILTDLLEERAAVAENPLLLWKAIKNPTEISGARTCHARDGRALSQFLAWLETASPGVTELEATTRLETFRSINQEYIEPSFPTISGSGPNGAIVHYRATPASNRTLTAGELYLVDSGAQYRDGTTDVTRTVFIGPGTPTEAMRDCFTRVLKGHIALAMVRFPKGTTGARLDALARYWLWQAGLDYAHGTGHGVGSFLSVHEGPQGISSRATATALQPGMILSNEPGYYREGAWGIRIENLVLVRDDLPQPEGAEIPLLGFETLTLAPIDLRLVNSNLLNTAEQGWLEHYHQRVAENLAT